MTIYKCHFLIKLSKFIDFKNLPEAVGCSLYWASGSWFKTNFLQIKYNRSNQASQQILLWDHAYPFVNPFGYINVSGIRGITKLGLDGLAKLYLKAYIGLAPFELPCHAVWTCLPMSVEVESGSAVSFITNHGVSEHN